MEISERILAKSLKKAWRVRWLRKSTKSLENSGSWEPAAHWAQLQVLDAHWLAYSQILLRMGVNELLISSSRQGTWGTVRASPFPFIQLVNGRTIIWTKQFGFTVAALRYELCRTAAHTGLGNARWHPDCGHHRPSTGSHSFHGRKNYIKCKPRDKYSSRPSQSGSSTPSSQPDPSCGPCTCWACVARRQAESCG